MRVAFVYPNPRGPLLHAIVAGTSPDTNLLGQNHLAEFGIDARVHDSFLRRRTYRDGLAHRLTWYGRELALPWELRDADLIVTPLATLLPLAARLRRKPRVLLLSYHLVAALERAGGARAGVQRAAIRSAAGVVTIAEAATGRLVDLARLDPRHVRTANLGVDERFWTPQPQPRDGYVLTVGRDLARDYATFVAAVATLPVRAVVVAKEENLRGIELPKNVDVRLNISPAEVRELYAGAACVVVPVVPESDPRGTESSGTIALLEAMASGCPTVVTARSYLQDYLHPDASLTVDAGDVGALRNAVARVLDDGALAASLGGAARSHVEAAYTTRHFAGRLAAVIESVAT